MSTQHTVAVIEGFQAEWEGRAAELGARLADQEEALRRGEEEIRELQQWLAASLQRRDELLAAREQTVQAQRALPAERDAAEYELLRSTLLAGLESVQAAQRRRERLAHIERDLSGLLEADPALARNLADYRAFEASQAQIAALPEYHQQFLLEGQRQLANKLQGYFELEQEVGRLRQPQPATLWLLAAELPGDMAGLVLPSVVDGEHALDALPADGLAAALLQALNGASGGKHIDGAWGGFAARLLGLSHTPLAQRVAQITAALAAAPGLEGVELQVRVLACSPEAWARAWDGPSVLDMGWYTLDDLRAWTRRVEAGSSWGPQPRRLRTLLIRMLGRGAVAPELVPAEPLWEALPEPHRGAMHQIVTRLCESGLLIGDPAGVVGVAPSRLDEVEQIITRKQAPAWATGQEPRPAMVG